MTSKKRHWLWNVLIVLTVILCVLAFVEHYKNWHKIEEGNLKILSGIYYQKIPLAELDSVLLVDKLPEMERSSGFSWMEKEKGVFNDSITNTKVYVFVDDLYQQKIKVVHHDSLKMYVNLKDSIKTEELFAFLQTELLNNKETAKGVQ
ncbi:MAG: hypothetical protein VX798_16685 [Bacteroidota bacterium]|uniref:Lipoprotein n=1 Tax=Flagellimonas profundi TaxID=2915620 RepID=A0ABS3FH49_9FLAO|nr:hypothetical protein [Allomuricauda profundi]MBO0342286.1 hypothetical protein [Allomuricauda profundi]MEC7772818.1 hypothetical protein [Bacteroidota bacterium]